jgi:hypothetical protein
MFGNAIPQRRNDMKSENFHFNSVAEQCRDELHRLRTKMDWPSHTHLYLSFSLKSTGEKDTFKFRFRSYTPVDLEVEASSIGTVMDEVYRRLDFHDRETARIDSSMRQLTDDRHNLDGI